MSSFFEELMCPITQTKKGKWLGIFPNEEDPNPYVVFATTQLLAMMLKHGGRTRNP
jgi:hypothetical protein